MESTLYQHCTNVVSTLFQCCFNVGVVSTLCDVENPTSDFVSFSMSDQRYFNVDPQRWNKVDPTLKCWLGKCSKSIPGFTISRLTNAEDFLNVNIFFKCKYVRINDYSFKYVCIVCCLKICFYCLTFFAMSNFNSADFTAPNIIRYFNSWIEMLFEFQNKTNIEMMGST